MMGYDNTTLHINVYGYKKLLMNLLLKIGCLWQGENLMGKFVKKLKPYDR